MTTAPPPSIWPSGRRAGAEVAHRRPRPSNRRSFGYSPPGWTSRGRDPAAGRAPGPSLRARCDLRPLRRDDRVLGEPVEQGAQPLANAVYRLDVTHGVGVELAGGDEGAVLEQGGPGVVGRVAARN